MRWHNRKEYMQYFKISTGKFIEFDEDSQKARIIVKADLVAEKQELVERIKINPQPTNKELLAWAKTNFPFVDHTAEQGELDKINVVLDAIKSL